MDFFSHFHVVKFFFLGPSLHGKKKRRITSTMNNPLILVIAVVVFGLIAFHNLYVGLKSIHTIQVNQQTLLWYKQPNMLLAASCILILLILLIDFTITSKFVNNTGELLVFLRVFEVILTIFAGLCLIFTLLAKRKQKGQ